MAGVSAEAVSRAKEVDLLTYLRLCEPDELVKTAANEYRTKSHGSLVISRGVWYWNRGGVGGKTALDYLIKVCGLGFVDAVLEVLQSRTDLIISGVSGVPPSAPQRREPDPPKQLILPECVQYAANVVAYLQNRGISPEVIRHCLEDGSLYEGRYGGKVVCVFVGRDESGEPRFACMRGVNSDLKRDCLGSGKRFGFVLPSAGRECPELCAFESPIDALSHATLYSDADAYRLSLGGTSPLALTAFLERNPQVERVTLCLDADEAGRLGAERIASALAADERFAHIQAQYAPPPMGKDYNEYLLTVLQPERERQQSDRRKTLGLTL